MEKHDMAGIKERQIPLGLILALAAIILVIAAAGASFYILQEQQIKDSVRNELTTIAVLKTGQIAEWRQDRLEDASGISASPFFIEGVAGYLASPNPADEEKIRSRLAEINSSQQYDNALLVDREGRVRFSLDPSVISLTPEVQQHLAASLFSHKPLLTDLYTSSDTGLLHMDAIAPLLVGNDGTEDGIGAVIFTINPDTTLYPLVQSWPIPSDTAETLLVEKKGDSVLFLNELRHQKNTSLNLTFPLTRTDIPAVMAVQGKTGVFEGNDYRGEQVVSVIEPVAGSPWFMVAKVDTAEAYAGWRSQAAFILILISIVLAGSIILAGLIWQRRQKYYYRNLYHAEAERIFVEKLNRERSETLLHLAGMETATDTDLAEYVLGAACRLTQSQLAFVGVMSADETVFDITAWSKRVMDECAVGAAPLRVPVEKAGIWADAVRERRPVIVNDYSADIPHKTGLPEWHATVTNYISVPVFEEQRIVMVAAVANKVSGYTDQDADQVALLMQGVWAHLRKRKTDEELRRKNADLEAAYEEIKSTEEELRQNYEQMAEGQKALAENEAKFREIFNNANDAIEIFEVRNDMHPGRYIDVNEVACRMLQYTKEEMLQHSPVDFDTTDYNMPPYDSVTKKLKSDGYATFETGHRRKDGTIVPVEVNYHITTLLGQKTGIAVVRDNTERKTAEKTLTESEKKYRTFFMTSQDCVFITTHDGRWLDFNDAAMTLFGYDSREELLSVPIPSLYAQPEARQRHIDTIITEGYTKEYPVNLRKKDGTVINALITTVLRKNPAGEVIGFQGTIRDVTEKRALEFELKKKYEELEAAYEQLTATDEEIRANYEDLAQSQKALSESENRYRRLFESAKDGILILNRDTGAIIDANPFISDLLGFTYGELIEKYIWEIGPLKDTLLSKIAFRELQDSGYIRYEDLPLETKDGRKISVEFVSNVYDIDHTSVIQCNIRDITERKRAEQALENSQAFLNSIIDQSPNAMWISDEHGTLIRLNKACCDILSIQPSEVIGRYNIFSDSIVREKGLIPLVRSVYDEGKTVKFELEYDSALLKGLPLERTTKVYLDVTIFPIRDVTGKITNAVIQHVDITERKRAEHALADEARRRHILIDQSRDGIVTLDEDGKVYEANQRFAEMLGYTSEEMNALHVWDWDTEIERGKLIEMIRTVDETGDHFETRHRRRDGSELDVEISTNAAVFSGKKMIFCVVRDITDRKEYEERLKRFSGELEQKVAERTKQLSDSLAERELLLREIHHRVKNNLQIVVSLFNLQARYIHDEKVLDAIRESQNRIRAMALVHERIYREEKLSSIDLKEYLRYLGDQLLRFYGIRPSQIAFKTALPAIQLDIDMAVPLGLVMNELISNSLKHAFPEGRKGTISINATITDHTLIFLVSDTGIGMPENFDWKNAPSLGLRLVISLIEQLNSTIEREPADTGTTFRIVTPIREKNRQDRPESKDR